ncbi:MAG: DNA replication/repair protein RecF, partial [Eggerthellaceae bacterium]|nr:DNA replication/repair protein RecF [Eggerthellaceae bacterium]
TQAKEKMLAAIKEAYAEETARKRATIGPHADTIRFYLSGRDAMKYASQGQQRSIVLAYKLAEAAVTEDILKEKQILLLDDVLSELDEKRRSALLEFVKGDLQTFITTTDTSEVTTDLIGSADVYYLDNLTEGPIKQNI